MTELDKFLDERSKIPIPSGDVARVKLLAKELALGVHRTLWSDTILTIQSNTRGDELWPLNENLRDFLARRWGDPHISNRLQLLHGHGYTRKIDSQGRQRHQISPSSFGLLGAIEPYNVFISYKRSDSSALALLVLTRLKQHGLVPFVDMAIKVGESWKVELHKRIMECDYFIVLLGRNTLKSEMTLQEIKWAIKYREQNKENAQSTKSIIPVWHSGFNISHKKWLTVDQTIRYEVDDRHAIRVTDESASGYNTAIVELLNRFGITP